MGMETRDYRKFTFIKANRAVNPLNVEKIKQSVKEWGVIPGRPILVNGDYQIIDGQHRFLAYKELGHPIPYEIITGDVIAKTMALNENQEHWRLIDYVSSYAEQGIDCYRQLLRFEEKNKLGFTCSLYICFGTGVKNKELKKGREYTISQNAQEIADYINNLDGVPFRAQKSFVWSLISLFSKTNAEQRLVIKNNILKIPNFQNTNDYKTAFENILNFKKGKNIVKL